MARWKRRGAALLARGGAGCAQVLVFLVRRACGLTAAVQASGRRVQVCATRAACCDIASAAGCGCHAQRRRSKCRARRCTDGVHARGSRSILAQVYPHVCGGTHRCRLSVRAHIPRSQCSRRVCQCVACLRVRHGTQRCVHPLHRTALVLQQSILCPHPRS